MSDEEIDAFRARESFWIDDWERLGGGPEAVADQVRFAREWGALRAYASERGVGLIGDVPIYVAPGGADHLAHPELFLGGEVSGAPPDDYSDLGQLWGNPLYDWPALQRSRYRWWTERLRRTFALFDVTRIDHFRGFVAYWAVPEGAADARGGRWRRGPGRAVFDAGAGRARRAAGDRRGSRRHHPRGDAAAARARPSRDGRHAVRLRPRRPARPAPAREPPSRQRRLHRHPRQRHAARLVGDAARGTCATPRPRRSPAPASQEAEPWWSLIRLTFGSPARLAMVQAQDVLGLGSEARMNIPGQATGIWRWQMAPGALTDELAQRLRAATMQSGRVAGS